MLSDNQKKYIDLLKNEPYKLGHWVGFDKLTDLHNEWIRELVLGNSDYALQAHRESYKTTAVSLAFAIYMILFPLRNIIFIRKTDDDVAEIIRQTRNIIESDAARYITMQIYGRPIGIEKGNANELTLGINATARGATQLLGLGIKASLTGKHAHWIHTDDIVNIKDRISRAEREYTKSIYMELQNIKMRGGKITNTGTPWHKDDAFCLMENIHKYDCYSTGLMSAADIEEKRRKMTASLFAANYELKHIANEQAMFKDMPETFSDDNLLANGRAHIDAAYGGEDGSVLTLCNKIGDKYYILGKRRQGHIDNYINEFIETDKYYQCGTIRCEDNGDKGYLAKEINKRGGSAAIYHESMNKFIKISTYLKGNWSNVIFHTATDSEYLSEIFDYSENADHDDSPDSCATIIRDYNTGRRGF